MNYELKSNQINFLMFTSPNDNESIVNLHCILWVWSGDVPNKRSKGISKVFFVIRLEFNGNPMNEWIRGHGSILYIYNQDSRYYICIYNLYI